MIILGIDPGTAAMGFGVVKKNGAELKCLKYGCIKTNPELAPAERLHVIHKELTKVIKEHKPEAMAVESLYFFKNLKTAFPVSQAKGVILLTAAKNKIPVFEFTPLQIKMTLVNYGRAEKLQIQRVVQSILGLEGLPKPDDAADALAAAICCSRLPAGRQGLPVHEQGLKRG